MTHLYVASFDKECYNISYTFGRNVVVGVTIMAASYKKLWKLLIDKDMKKKDLEKKAQISHYVIGKLNRGETVTTETLEKICKALGCSLDDIMEFLPDSQED